MKPILRNIKIVFQVGVDKILMFLKEVSSAH